MALTRSRLPTSSTRNAWRAGMSKALTRPNPSARTITCHTAITLARTSTPSAVASAIWSAWVSTMRRRLSTRSTTMPAYSVHSRTPSERRAWFRPTANAELVRSRTSQPSATDCIQEPMSEMPCP